MFPNDLPAWLVGLGASLPGIGMGLWQFIKWWRESETAEARAEREERERKEDRAKAASEQIWREVQRELDRAYRRIDELERESAWYEGQARIQHAAAWELRGTAADARQAFIALRARTGGGEEIPPAWLRPMDVPRVEAPPRPIHPPSQPPQAA